MLGLGVSLWRNNARVWTPAALGSDLALWLDAADSSTITLNGSTVSQWSDKSNNARHATQGTAANQPTYTANGLNGKPVLTFDGSSHFLSIGALTGSRIVSVLAVAATNNTSQDGYVLDESGSASTGGGLSIRFTSTGAVRFWGQVAVGGADATGVVQGAASIIGGVESATAQNSYLNGVASNTATPSGGSRSALNGRIGHSQLLGGFLNGNIAEIILANSALSTENRQRLEGYYAWKWALEANLPVGHPFKSAPPFV